MILGPDGRPIRAGNELMETPRWLQREMIDVITRDLAAVREIAPTLYGPDDRPIEWPLLPLVGETVTVCVPERFYYYEDEDEEAEAVDVEVVPDENRMIPKGEQ